MGTVGYMAPEQVRAGTVDHRADIFALGCVLYELVSGQRAFAATSAIETMHAILHAEPPDLSAHVPAVSSGVERIVRRCLEKDPAQRFQSARDLAFALEAVSDTRSSTATTPALPGEAPARIPLARSGRVGRCAGCGYRVAGQRAWESHAP
jgi:serine/threonine protein kinase